MIWLRTHTYHTHAPYTRAPALQSHTHILAPYTRVPALQSGARKLRSAEATASFWRSNGWNFMPHLAGIRPPLEMTLTYPRVDRSLRNRACGSRPLIYHSSRSQGEFRSWKIGRMQCSGLGEVSLTSYLLVRPTVKATCGSNEEG